MSSNAFFVTIPHSGEEIPSWMTWLKTLPEPVLMCDVDRFVDRLYEPGLALTKTPFIKTKWHRYVVDLNRLPEDIDQATVEEAPLEAGKMSRGFHWLHTTLKEPLLPRPLTQTEHLSLKELVYDPFHKEVVAQQSKLKAASGVVYHLDAHSMPSIGTSEHRDPGQIRADIVVSDSFGKSCSEDFKDIVVSAFVTAGFKVGYNWPYYGGRLTEQYGKPEKSEHTLQVELNRALYMNEKTKKLDETRSLEVQRQITKALVRIREQLDKLPKKS